MEPRELAPGYSVSPVIKGGWQLSVSHSDDKSDTPVEDMFEFVDSGVTTFDCADIYTGVEDLIGDFREAYRERRGEEAPIQVHTKFVPDQGVLEEIDEAYVREIIDRSRSRLGMDAIDLVQFHWWDYSAPRYLETAQTLADLHEEGKIAHVGVTNWDVPHLRELTRGGVPVVSHQVQYSVLDTRPEREMVDFCAANDVRLLCYGTLAGGFLTERYLGEPEPEAPLENRSLTKYKLVIDEIGGWDAFQGLLKALKEVADKHGVSIANVASRYVLEQPRVCSVIVGARDTSHLADTVRMVEFDFDDDDRERVREARANLGSVPGGVYGVERVRTSRHAKIMKYDLNDE